METEEEFVNVIDNDGNIDFNRVKVIAEGQFKYLKVERMKEIYEGIVAVLFDTGLIEIFGITWDAILRCGQVDKNLWLFGYGEDWIIILEENNGFKIYHFDNWELLLNYIKDKEPIDEVSI